MAAYFDDVIQAIERKRWSAHCSSAAVRQFTSESLHAAILRGYCDSVAADGGQSSPATFLRGSRRSKDLVSLCLLRRLRSLDEPLGAEDILKYEGSVPSGVLVEGRTPVMTAVFMRDLPALQLLRQAGASFTLRCAADGQNTALHYAAMFGLADMVRYMIPLIPRYQLIDPNSAGDSPLHVACRYGHYSLVPLFLEHAIRLWKEDVFVFHSLRRSKEKSSMEESVHVLKKRKSLMELQKAPLPKVLRAMLINVSSPTAPQDGEEGAPEGETVLHLLAKNQPRDPKQSASRPTDTIVDEEPIDFVTTTVTVVKKEPQRSSGAWLNLLDRHIDSVQDLWKVCSSTASTAEAAAADQPTPADGEVAGQAESRPMNAYEAVSYILRIATEHQLLVPMLLTRTLYYGDCALALAGDDRMLDVLEQEHINLRQRHSLLDLSVMEAAVEHDDDTDEEEQPTDEEIDNETQQHATPMKKKKKHFLEEDDDPIKALLKAHRKTSRIFQQLCEAGGSESEEDELSVDDAEQQGGGSALIMNHNGKDAFEGSSSNNLAAPADVRSAGGGSEEDTHDHSMSSLFCKRASKVLGNHAVSPSMSSSGTTPRVVGFRTSPAEQHLSDKGGSGTPRTTPQQQQQQPSSLDTSNGSLPFHTPKSSLQSGGLMTVSPKHGKGEEEIAASGSEGGMGTSAPQLAIVEPSMATAPSMARFVATAETTSAGPSQTQDETCASPLAQSENTKPLSRKRSTRDSRLPSVAFHEEEQHSRPGAQSEDGKATFQPFGSRLSTASTDGSAMDNMFTRHPSSGGLASDHPSSIDANDAAIVKRRGLVRMVSMLLRNPKLMEAAAASSISVASPHGKSIQSSSSSPSSPNKTQTATKKGSLLAVTNTAKHVKGPNNTQQQQHLGDASFNASMSRSCNPSSIARDAQRSPLLRSVENYNQVWPNVEKTVVLAARWVRLLRHIREYEHRQSRQASSIHNTSSPLFDTEKMLPTDRVLLGAHETALLTVDAQYYSPWHTLLRQRPLANPPPQQQGSGNGRPFTIGPMLRRMVELRRSDIVAAGSKRQLMHRASQGASPELNLSILPDSGTRDQHRVSHVAGGTEETLLNQSARSASGRTIPNKSDYSVSDAATVELAMADLPDTIRDVLSIWGVFNKQDERRSGLHLLALRNDAEALQTAFVEYSLEDQCFERCWEPCAHAMLQQLEEDLWAEEHVTLPGIIAARVTLEAAAAASGNSQSLRMGASVNANASVRGPSIARAASIKSTVDATNGSPMNHNSSIASSAPPANNNQPTAADLECLKERSQFLQVAESFAVQMTNAAAQMLSATVELRDADGMSPLQLAVMHNAAESMQVLVHAHTKIVEELGSFLLRLREVGERREAWLRNAATAAAAAADQALTSQSSRKASAIVRGSSFAGESLASPAGHAAEGGNNMTLNISGKFATSILSDDPMGASWRCGTGDLPWPPPAVPSASKRDTIQESLTHILGDFCLPGPTLSSCAVALLRRLQPQSGVVREKQQQENWKRALVNAVLEQKHPVRVKSTLLHLAAEQDVVMPSLLALMRWPYRVPFRSPSPSLASSITSPDASAAQAAALAQSTSRVLAAARDRSSSTRRSPRATSTSLRPQQSLASLPNPAPQLEPEVAQPVNGSVSPTNSGAVSTVPPPAPDTRCLLDDIIGRVDGDGLTAIAISLRRQQFYSASLLLSAVCAELPEHPGASDVWLQSLPSSSSSKGDGGAKKVVEPVGARLAETPWCQQQFRGTLDHTVTALQSALPCCREVGGLSSLAAGLSGVALVRSIRATATTVRTTPPPRDAFSWFGDCEEPPSKQQLALPEVVTHGLRTDEAPSSSPSAVESGAVLNCTVDGPIKSKEREHQTLAKRLEDCECAVNGGANDSAWTSCKRLTAIRLLRSYWDRFQLGK